MNPKSRLRVSLLITAGAGIALLSVAAVTWPWNGLSYWEWERELHSGHVFYSARTSERVVALTFDDGPDPRYTPAVLDILRRHGIRATFFLCGHMVARNPALARRIAAEGHAIGNHSDTHPHMERERQTDVHSEIDHCGREIEIAASVRPTLFRPPRGMWNPAVFREARRAGCDIVLWSLAFDRASLTDKAALASRLVRLAHPGDIILLHDGSASLADERRGTVQELDAIIAGLQNRGFRFATVPDLLRPESGARIRCSAGL